MRLALCANALALRGALTPLEIFVGRYATNSPPRGDWDEIDAFCYGGSFDFARIEFMHRWQ
jgi:hypothetical protein